MIVFLIRIHFSTSTNQSATKQNRITHMFSQRKQILIIWSMYNKQTKKTYRNLFNVQLVITKKKRNKIWMTNFYELLLLLNSSQISIWLKCVLETEYIAKQKKKRKTNIVDEHEIFFYCKSTMNSFYQKKK